MSYQFFFGFGHQATIPSLRFDAAFVGVYGEMTTFKLPIAGLFVTVNTLASQVHKMVGCIHTHTCRLAPLLFSVIPTDSKNMHMNIMHKINKHDKVNQQDMKKWGKDLVRYLA